MGSATGSNQVVDDQDSVTRDNTVDVYLDLIGSIFQLVCLTNGLPGQLAFFPHSDETNGKLVCDCSTQDETARFNAGHGTDVAAGKRLDQFIDSSPKAGGILKQCRDVPENHTSLGIVGD